MAKVLVFHPVTERVAEITDHALPIVAASGWVLANADGIPVEGWTAPADGEEPALEPPETDDEIPDEDDEDDDLDTDNESQED